ncbi:pesticidal protein Cry7Aa [Candidatus Parcubacteria bacterium]|nr:pesticidal protein Cry7Aa [Candidatus Parcubacteria bacterium]
MLRVTKHGAILRPSKLKFENRSVFNPGVFQDGDKVQIIYRALNKNFMSCFGYAELKGPLEVVKRWKKPLYTPKLKCESKGIEDPRITKIGNTFFVIYVAHDGRHAVIAYMRGQSLFRLKRGGIISPTMKYRDAVNLFGQAKLKDDYYFFASFYEKFAHKNVKVWEKDGVLFPEKIRGKYALLHRVLPDIQLARFKNFKEPKTNGYWKKHIENIDKHVVLEGRHGWEARHIGSGAPPIKTNKGWLIIYHGVEPRNKGRVYCAGAALLDLKYPTKVIARLPDPLFVPEHYNERNGHVHNVVFPTGTTEFNERLYIYYGSADSRVSVASVNKEKLIKELLKHKVKN